MILVMNVSAAATQTALQAVSDATNVENRRANLQMALLKKTLQSEQQQADDLMKLMSGKGQNIDLRV